MKVWRRNLEHKIFSREALDYLDSYLKDKGLFLREREIAISRLFFFTHQEVANFYGQSVKAVKFHNTNIYRKLGVKNQYAFLLNLPFKEMFEIDYVRPSGDKKLMSWQWETIRKLSKQISDMKIKFVELSLERSPLPKGVSNIKLNLEEGKNE